MYCYNLVSKVGYRSRIARPALTTTAKLDTIFRRDHQRLTIALDKNAMRAEFYTRKAARASFIIDDGIPTFRHVSTLAIVKSLP
jgi:hypothetical protein